MRLERETFANPADIDAILGMRRVAMVGASSDQSRDSNHVMHYLLRAGYDVVPVNPSEEEIFGVRAYPSLADLPEAPEVVDVFRRPEFVNDIVDQAIAVGAKAVWLQQGVINPEAAKKARDAGLLVVMDRCMKIEHMRRQRW